MSLGGIRKTKPLLTPDLIFSRRFSSQDAQVSLVGLCKGLWGVYLPLQLKAASVLVITFWAAIWNVNFTLFQWDTDTAPTLTLHLRQARPVPPMDAEVWAGPVPGDVLHCTRQTLSALALPWASRGISGFNNLQMIFLPWLYVVALCQRAPPLNYTLGKIPLLLFFFFLSELATN